MKNTYITIVGNLSIRFDLHESMHIGPVIASANSNKSINFINRKLAFDFKRTSQCLS